MCAMMLIHMMQVFLHGTYKYPRELTWVVGVFLCITTLALAFTGQVMRWDADAYWGLGIGAAIVDRVPFAGNWLRAVVLGGPDISGATLSRFFSLSSSNFFRRRSKQDGPATTKSHPRQANLNLHSSGLVSSPRPISNS